MASASNVVKCTIGVILLDIPVRQVDFSEAGIRNIEAEVLSCVEHPLGYFEKLYTKRLENTSKIPQYVAFFMGRRGTSIVVKTYPNRNLVTITIEYDQLEYGGKPVLSYSELKELETDLVGTFDLTKTAKATPEVKRGLNKDIYFTTSDDRLVEYDIQEILFDEQSKFQHIQIAKSGNYGNILILDDLVNLADSDLIYTETIMSRGNIDYKGKEILILGGGDGCLLHELRKESAAFITMVEIDEVVMKACQKFMRKSCGDTLDSYNQSDYEILVGDCVEFMEACKKDGKRFDVIFGDLTEIPISSTPQGEIWDFLKKILNLSMSILKDDGWYLTHGNGASVPEALEMYEKHVLESLDIPVQSSKKGAFVPSFMEEWIFYRIKKVVN